MKIHACRAAPLLALAFCLPTATHAEEGDATIIVTAATATNAAEDRVRRTPGGAYTSNIMEAFVAVSCLDRPADAEGYREAMEEAQRRAPTWGRFMVGASSPCDFWPHEPVGGGPRVIEAPGSAPIVVVGTTNDPATPYAWSVSLAEQLSSGVLVTRDGEGHTGYNKGNACVDGAVEDYLVNGTVPQDGLTCTS